MRVVVTRIDRYGTVERRVVDTAARSDVGLWEELIARALAARPPYRPVPGSPVYHLRVDDRAVWSPSMTVRSAVGPGHGRTRHRRGSSGLSRQPASPASWRPAAGHPPAGVPAGRRASGQTGLVQVITRSRRCRLTGRQCKDRARPGGGCCPGSRGRPRAGRWRPIARPACPGGWCHFFRFTAPVTPGTAPPPTQSSCPACWPGAGLPGGVRLAQPGTARLRRRSPRGGTPDRGRGQGTPSPAVRWWPR